MLFAEQRSQYCDYSFWLMCSPLDPNIRPSFRGGAKRRARNPQPQADGMAYYVYILASRKYGTLYIGITSDLVRRVYEHKIKMVPGFTKRYGVDKLVLFEVFDEPASAIAREKELKKWRRDWKTRLIDEQNPNWDDLYNGISN